MAQMYGREEAKTLNIIHVLLHTFAHFKYEF